MFQVLTAVRLKFSHRSRRLRVRVHGHRPSENAAYSTDDEERTTKTLRGIPSRLDKE